MKKIIIQIFVSLITASTLFAQKVNPDKEGIPVLTKQQTIFQAPAYTTLVNVKAALDSTGNIYLVFNDPNISCTYISNNKSGEWVTETLVSGENNNDYNPKYPVIAIDKSQTIHVVYTRHASELIYASKKIGEEKWKVSEINNKLTKGLNDYYIFADYMDICTDDENGLHLIAMGDGHDNQGKSIGKSCIYFYRSPDGKWKNEIVREGITDTYSQYGENPSIAINGKNLDISFGGDNSINYAQKNVGDDSWQIEQLLFDDFMNGGKTETSLGLTPEGNPVFAYVDYYGEGNFFGFNIFSKQPCTGNWQTDPSGEFIREPSLAIDNDGVVFWTNNYNGLSMYYRTCTCEQNWKRIFNDNEASPEFTDIVIDKRNHVHTFYTTYDKIKYLEAWFEGDPEKDCNFRPSISCNASTNVKPGQEWSCAISAYDPECDSIYIYAETLPDGFAITDHGNGTATLKGTISENEGEMEMIILCNDDQHPETDGEYSSATLNLKITGEGKEKGSLSYKNSCTGKKNTAKYTLKTNQ